MTLVKSSPPPKAQPRKDAPINAEYQEKAKALLRERIDGDYSMLAEKLNAMGIEITPRGLENKISRGGFSAAFLLQCLDAIGESLFRT
tara:strand:+ start:10095 stop:10358 length:264 start_codon:yes stop_codon:yes gene_type:complete